MFRFNRDYDLVAPQEGYRPRRIVEVSRRQSRSLPICRSEYIPVGRFGTPTEVASIVLSLVQNAYVTGQTISVNGGVYGDFVTAESFDYWRFEKFMGRARVLLDTFLKFRTMAETAIEDEKRSRGQ